MNAPEPKADLHRYLQAAREALLWKLDGLGEYDVRRPLVPTGTNLLGLVKHVASVEAGYLGDTFGRPFPEPLPWLHEDAEPNADLWATPAETREQIVGLYHRVWTHSQATIDALPLDAIGQVPWWPPERREVLAAGRPGLVAGLSEPPATSGGGSRQLTSARRAPADPSIPGRFG
jgi:hypothetical protein